MKLHLYRIACILNMIVLCGYTSITLINLFSIRSSRTDGVFILLTCILLLFVLASLIKSFIGYRYAVNLAEYKWVDPAYLHRFYFLYVLQCLLFLLFCLIHYVLFKKYIRLIGYFHFSVESVMTLIALLSVPLFLITTAYILVMDIFLSKRINNQSHLADDLLKE